MSILYVRVGTRNIRFDLVTFEKWFPGLAALYHWHNHVDLGPLAGELKVRLTGHTSVPVRTHHVFDALEDLFKVLSGWGFEHSWGSREGRVKDMMEQFLKEERLGTDYRGLYRTRNRFLILCVVAFCTHSTRLASALGSFVEHKVRRIVEYEEPLHLPEWCLGLCELRNLVPEYELQQLIDQLTDIGSGLASGWDFPPYYGHYPLRPHHGRRALLELPGWDPRALPAAGLRRFRSLDDLRVGRPLQSAWPSPSMSPTRLPVNDYLDEAEAIQCEQLAQAIELEAVKRRVKQLEYMR